ncbi:hypothetical protein IQ254_17250 [Nodosilinea sp. LEGE 07088]|uniref:hypothetical protein n=1 Tax=Nodosilinea sp. LEGE 07088 TaxID=2777968 RepID=UPI0018801978|nr:hypothetical protein [Nodosilinea sp. LEGE 07088]MBE9138918.1 hypothetical protein [Nodosilinea sp. LEGE 07088]
MDQGQYLSPFLQAVEITHAWALDPGDLTRVSESNHNALKSLGTLLIHFAQGRGLYDSFVVT